LATEPLIDRKFLERLEQLTIRWHRVFPGLVGGHQTSRVAGPGLEFFDHRHFTHGDDVRAVNWRAYLRLEKMFLKMFQTEPRVPLRILLDTSLSMQTGSPPKSLYAKKLAAALAYIAMVRLDSIAVHPFAEALGEVLLCCGGRHRFGPVSEYLSQLPVEGSTDFFEVARQFSARHVQRGLLIIISDFLGAKDWERPLQYLAEFGHELLLIQVWGEEDREPPWEGELALTEVETGEMVELDFDDAARRRYTEAFDGYSDSLRKLALRYGGRHVGLATSLPVEDAVFGPLVVSQGVE